MINTRDDISRLVLVAGKHPEECGALIDPGRALESRCPRKRLDAAREVEWAESNGKVGLANQYAGLR